MIAYITGKIHKIEIGKDSFVDILTAGGIAYRVNIPSNYVCPEVGQEYSLYTYYHVKEDSQTLYGFSTEQEKDLFKDIISVSGVGPKIGLSIMSTYTREDLADIIEQGDAKKLGKTPGLGLKRAQKIIIELKGKVDLNISTQNVNDTMLKDLKDALKVLGYSKESLREKVDYAQGILEKDKDIEIEDLIKEVLKQ